MQIGPTVILDNHAEAFAARYVRLVVTAADGYWVDAAARAATGYGTSVIGCDCEAGLAQLLRPSDTPDGRPGAVLLFFAFTSEKLASAVANRVAQCVLTCPTTACFNGLPNATTTIPLGDYCRFFGDGYEKRGARNEERGTSTIDRTQSSQLDLRSSYWRIPVMDGEFVVDDVAGIGRGVAGGNLIIHADSQDAGLTAACRAVEAVKLVPEAIMPFPGGVCRSGSKVGSKYNSLIASTAETYCPTLRDEVVTQLVDGATCAYEIIINGVDEAAVRAGMREAVEAAAGRGVLAIGARHFGGKLGKIAIRLRELLP